MQRKKQILTPRSPSEWIKETINDLLYTPSDTPLSDEDTSDSREEHEEADPEEPREEPPSQQP